MMMGRKDQEDGCGLKCIYLVPDKHNIPYFILHCHSASRMSKGKIYGESDLNLCAVSAEVVNIVRNDRNTAIITVQLHYVCTNGFIVYITLYTSLKGINNNCGVIKWRMKFH
jgi:hypothetical protein